MKRPTAALLLCAFILNLIAPALAAPPVWWSSGNPPVINPLAPANNRGPASVGQAKWMAKSALEALRAVDPATAVLVENDLSAVTSFAPPVTPAQKEAQRAPLLIGQLKALSAPFYNRLHVKNPLWLNAQRVLNNAVYPDTHLPWTIGTADDANQATANIGQLKSVFSLHFDSLVQGNPGDPEDPEDPQDPPDGPGDPPVEEPETDSDNDGIVDSQDAKPNDPKINWERTPEAKYVWIPIDTPAGYEAIDCNDKGQMLFNRTEPLVDQEYVTTPVGKLWSPSVAGSGAGNSQWKNIIFQPDSFKIFGVARSGDVLQPDWLEARNTPDPITPPQSENHSYLFRGNLTALGDDGSVVGSAHYSYGDFSGYGSADLGFVWRSGTYDKCKVLGEDENLGLSGVVSSGGGARRSLKSIASLRSSYLHRSFANAFEKFCTDLSSE